MIGANQVLEALQPATPSGRRRLSALTAWTSGDEPAWREANDRMRQTDAWVDRSGDAHDTLTEALLSLPEADRLLSKCRARTVLEDGELFVAKRLLYHGARAFEAGRELLEEWGAESDLGERARAKMAALHPERAPSARFRLSASLVDGLDDARRASKESRRQLDAVRREVEATLVAELGGSFDVRGFYHPAPGIEPSRLMAEARLALLDGRWRPATEELERARSELDAANAKTARLEQSARAKLSRILADDLDLLLELEERLGELDFRLAAVRMRRDMDGCWPEVAAATAIAGGRDPRLVKRLGDEVQPIDVTLHAGATVVTGPNMGGKSALLRLVGLVQWLAQHGLPVPADSASVRFVDRMVYIGSEEPGAADHTEGLSSFGREIRRLVESQEDDVHTLWLLDELGRGTHPDDGAALAVEVVTRLAERGDEVVASTHFPALAALESARHLRIRGLVDEPTLARSVAESRGEVELRAALQRAMDYRPDEVTDDEVPRDARIVARALGLWRDAGEETT